MSRLLWIFAIAAALAIGGYYFRLGYLADTSFLLPPKDPL